MDSKVSTFASHRLESFWPRKMVQLATTYHHMHEIYSMKKKETDKTRTGINRALVHYSTSIFGQYLLN